MSAITADVMSVDQPKIAKERPLIMVIEPEEEKPELGVLDCIVEHSVEEIYDPNKGSYLTQMQMADLTEETYYKTFFGDQYEQYI